MNGSKIRVFVTGGSGFIGSCLVENLRADRIPVCNLDLQAPISGRHKDCWTQGDIMDLRAVEVSLARFQPTHVVHLAARTDLSEKNSLAGYAANVQGTEHVVRAVTKTSSVTRAIITSSMLVCRPGYAPCSETDYAPTTYYGRSKVLTERITRESKLPCVWTLVRPTTIWGPWHQGMRAGIFSVLESGFYVHPSGRPARRAYGFVGNVAHQFRRILNAPIEQIHGRTLYLGDPPIDLREWVGSFSRRLRGKDVRVAPRFLLRIAARIGDLLAGMGQSFPLTSYRLANMLHDNVVDLAPTFRVTGEGPYSMEAGIEETVRWLQGQSKPDSDEERLAA